MLICAETETVKRRQSIAYRTDLMMMRSFKTGARCEWISPYDK